MFRILIAEDDKGTRRLMEDTLADAGYEPISAADGQEALELLTRTHVDLLILDVMMPRLDGFALLAALRRSGSQLPVLMLTAKEALADKKQWLRLGADDYMTKPADEEEMLLRIQALLRRAQAISSRRLTVGGTTLVYDDLAVEWSGTVTDLPRKEFQLLYKLLSCPDKTFTRRQLMDEIWDLATDSDEHTVNVHINIFSHEFKTPIVSIRGFARRLRRGGLTREQQAEYLDFIVEESERLSKLASNVLLISRYENQKLVTEQTDYDLDEQIRTSVLRLESQWAPRGLIFELDLPRLPYRNNSEMMEHVWTNLISNAVKFSRDEGAIFISGTQENGRIVVTVRDEGVGIRPQDLGHIFDKFYQGDSSRVSVGNGLGLALVHRIVELSGGSITAESTLGRGSTFRLKLPVHPAG